MLTAIVLQMFLAGSMQMPAGPTFSQNLQSIEKSSCVTIASSGRVAPGPDHGADPHREVHDVDPYNWSTGNGSDPYGGSTTNGSDPYGGRFPGAPAPKDPYGGNIPD
jgi:hypothetical protein